MNNEEENYINPEEGQPEEGQLEEVEIQLLEQHKKRKRPLWKRFARLVFRSFMLLLLLLGLIRVLISYPTIQNRLVHGVADYLSDRLHTEVSVGYVNFYFFDKMRIENVLVRDLDQDTLLFSELLSIDIGVFSLLRKKTRIDNVLLKNAQYNFEAPKNGYLSSEQFIYDIFFPPEAPEPPTPEKTFPWNLDIKKVTLENVGYKTANFFNGVRRGYHLGKGVIDIDKFDLKTKEILIGNIFLNQVSGYHYVDTLILPVPPGVTVYVDTFPQYIDTFPRTPLLLKVKHLAIRNGGFKLDNEIMKTGDFGPDNLNYKHMVFQDLKVDLANITLYKNELTGRLQNLSVKEHKGFVIDSLYGDLRVNAGFGELQNMVLKTPNSELKDYLSFTFKNGVEDFGYFVDQVKLDVQFRGAKIAIKDLLMVAPALQNNAFFAKNEKEIIYVDGNAKNVVNRLKVRDVTMRIGNTRLKGDFSSNNITIPLEAFMNLKLDYFYSNMKNIQLLFRDVKFPPQVMRLGNLAFKGRLDGFLLDFVAEGQLKTDLGTATSDLRMNLKPGREYGSYSGKLALKDFEMGKWLEQDDLGIVNFSANVKGQGFKLQDIKTEIDASIQDIAFKGYTYRDLAIDGLLEKKLFDGKLSVKDENIDLVFDGKVDLNDSLPVFDLSTNFNYINLKPLNLVNFDYELNGNIKLDFVGNTPNNIKGIARLTDFKVVSNDTTYTLDSLVVKSEIDLNNARFYDIQSELLSAYVVSNFDFIKVQDLLVHYFSENYESFATALRLKEVIKKDSAFVYVPDNPLINEYYTLDVKVNSTKNWLNLFTKNVSEIKHLTINSNFDSQISDPNTPSKMVSAFNFNLDFPMLAFNNIKIGPSYFKMKGIGEHCTVDAEALEILIGDSLDIPSVVIQNEINGGNLAFTIDGDKIGKISKSLMFKGHIKAVGQQIFRINIDTSDIILYNREWNMSEGNQLTIYKNKVVPENLTLTQFDNNERISIDSFGQKGLKLDIQNISLEWLKEFVDLKNMQFDGRVNAIVEIEDLFKAHNFRAITEVDSFKMNGEYLGVLNADISFPDIMHPIAIDANIKKLDSQVNIFGSYTSPNVEESFEKNDHYLSFKIEARDYPLSVAEIFIGEIISDTKGSFNGDILLTGTPSEPKIAGNVRLQKAGLMVNYLQTYYRIERATIEITNDAFIIAGINLLETNGNITKGTIIRDADSNQALVQGEVSHNNLKDYRFNVHLVSNKFTLLNTKKEDNELFYGTAIGEVDMSITGPLDAPDINITATSLEGTEIALPITYESTSSEVSFIKFTNPLDTSKVEKPKFTTPKGLSLFMNLDVNTNAKIRLIFDEQVGDEIQGTGNGNLQLEITRTGDFSMNGKYTIEKGEYLFTIKSAGINKPFEVRKGGTINWTGDPLGAELNLNAYYRNLNVRPYNFILEYLNSADEESLAKRSTKVDLLMRLRGDLFQPDITFGLDFPKIDNNLKPYTDSKLKLVDEDENELNRQVFGLIVLGDFLPSNASTAGVDLVESTLVNTLTEMLSNQLSLYVTDLLHEVLGQNSAISSIDVDVSIRRDNGLVSSSDPLANLSTTGYQVGLRNGWFNDRLIVSGVVNYDDGYQQYSGEFELEWMLTKDGRWRVKGYNRNELVIGDIRNNAGVGISYQREFDTLSELLKTMFKKAE